MRINYLQLTRGGTDDFSVGVGLICEDYEILGAYSFYLHLGFWWVNLRFMVNRNEATTRAWKAYREATATAEKAYIKIVNQAWKAYDEAVAPAKKAFEEARAKRC